MSTTWKNFRDYDSEVLHIRLQVEHGSLAIGYSGTALQLITGSKDCKGIYYANVSKLMFSEGL